MVGGIAVESPVVNPHHPQPLSAAKLEGALRVRGYFNWGAWGIPAAIRFRGDELHGELVDEQYARDEPANHDELAHAGTAAQLLF